MASRRELERDKGWNCSGRLFHNLRKLAEESFVLGWQYRRVQLSSGSGWLFSAHCCQRLSSTPAVAQPGQRRSRQEEHPGRSHHEPSLLRLRRLINSSCQWCVIITSRRGKHKGRGSFKWYQSEEVRLFRPKNKTNEDFNSVFLPF